MIDRIKAFCSSLWVFFTGMTLAQFNALLGTISLILGISFQLWKWRKEAREAQK